MMCQFWRLCLGLHIYQHSASKYPQCPAIHAIGEARLPVPSLVRDEKAISTVPCNIPMTSGISSLYLLLFVLSYPSFDSPKVGIITKIAALKNILWTCFPALCFPSHCIKKIIREGTVIILPLYTYQEAVIAPNVLDPKGQLVDCTMANVYRVFSLEH